MISNKIDVVKRDHLGWEVFRYPGQVLELNDSFVLLEAFFTFEAVEVEEIVLKQGDRFLETYYFDRWYNIFEIHSKLDDRLKAYYCNIGYPAVLVDGEVSYRDLALDLLVRPDGQTGRRSVRRGPSLRNRAIRAAGSQVGCPLHGSNRGARGTFSRGSARR